MTSTALSADLFTLSKKTSVGRLGELQAAAGAFGAAELTLRRGFNFNAELGAFAKANANVRKFAAASLGVEAKAGARIQAQAQFPLDFFSECGAVCRLTAAAEAGIYGSLSIGMALEDFRRLYAHDQAGLAMRLGEIFLDEVTVEGGAWAKAAISAEASVSCVIAGSLLPHVRTGRPPGFTAAFSWGLGLLYGTGFSTFVKIGIRNARRLVARTADELTAVAIELVEQGAASAASARPMVPYVRMLLPVALRASYELGALTAGAKGPQARKETRAKLAEIARTEAQALAAELLATAGLQQMRRLLDAPKVRQAVSTLSGDAASRARKALEDFQGAVPRRPSLTAVPRLIGPFLEFVSIVKPDDRDRWVDAAATVWAALAMVSVARVSSGAQIAAAMPDPGAQVRGHVNRRIGRDGGAKLDARAAGKFLVETKALDEIAKAFPESRPVIDWLGQLFPSGTIPLADFLFGTVEERRDLSEEAWRALRDGLRRAAKDRLESEVGMLLERAARDDQLRELVHAVVKPAVLALGEVLDNVDELGTAEGRLVFREQVSLVLLQIVGRNVVLCGDILITKALADAARGMRGLAGQLNGNARSDFLSSAQTVLKLTGASPRKKLVDMLEFGAGLAELWGTPERAQVRNSLLDLVDVLGSKKNTKGVFKKVAGSKSFIPNAKELKAFLKQSAVTLGKLILRAIWLYFKQLIEDIKQLVMTAAKALVDAAKKLIRALESAVRELKAALRTLVDQIKRLARAVAQLANTIRDAVRQFKARLTSSALRDRAVRALRDIGEAGLLAVVHAHPVYRLLPLKKLKREADKLARKAYRGVFDATLGPVVRAALAAVGEIAGILPEASGISAEASSARIEAAIAGRAKSQIRRELSRRQKIHIGIKVAGKRIGLDLKLPIARMVDTLADLVASDGTLQGLARRSAGATQERTAREREQRASEKKRATEQQRVSKAQGELKATEAGALRVQIAAPKDGEVESGAVELGGSIRGANESFIAPPRSGARRVQALIDGRPLAFRREDWRWIAARREIAFRHRLDAGTRAGGHTFSLLVADGRRQEASASAAFGYVA